MYPAVGFATNAVSPPPPKPSIMRLALIQWAPGIGRLEHNAERMGELAKKAALQGADAVVFPELSLVGYPPMDLLREPGLQEACTKALGTMAASATIPLLVGAPSKVGSALYNAVFWCNLGEVREVGRKVLLPNYDVFDESRYFTPGEACSTIEIAGQSVVLSICEDLWAQDADYNYPRDPVAEALALDHGKPRVLLNLAASPYSIQGVVKRQKVLSSVAARYGLPLLYVNQVGARADLIFDGGSSLISGVGETVVRCPSFLESMLLVEVVEGVALKADVIPLHANTWVASRAPSVLENKPPEKSHPLVLGHRFDPVEVTQALCTGLRDYRDMTGGQGVVVGLSGGLDSAMVTCLAVMALGAENVTALLMPSEYSSDRSVRDSLELCKMHGVAHRILPIGSAFGSIKETLLNQWGEAIRPLTEENIQPRLRALYLMAHSNQFGDMWLNSSNKSEAAVGYSTLYGDMGGGLSVVGDLYKTQLYALANYWNEQGSWIPASIVQALPSAELRPDQLDTDSLPPYPLLDALLMDLIEGGLDRAGLYQAGHDPDIVSRVWGLVRRSEFKRFQMPPVLRVSSRSFGRGWRQSLV